MKRRARETCKTILIVLLALSAAVLAVTADAGSVLRKDLSGLPAPLRTLLNLPGPELSYAVPAATADEAARPITAVVNASGGRSAYRRDFDAVDTVYESLGRHLGEALDAAETPASCSENDWRAALGRESVYFDYAGPLPLAALASWLGAEAPDSALTVLQSARLLLSVEDDLICLYLEDSSGQFWRCQTPLQAETLVLQLETYRPDGTVFAFESTDFSRVDPYSVINLSAAPVCPAATVSNPAESTDFSSAIATALGFNPYGGTGYVDSSGARVYAETDTRLTLSSDGFVVLTGNGAEQTLLTADSSDDAALVEKARFLVSTLSEGRIGDARLYLTGLTRDGDTATASFSYMLSGMLVRTDTAAAEVVFTGKTVTSLRWYARTYTLTGKTETLLPALQAAALLPAGDELVTEYADTGAKTLESGWRS